MSPANDSDIAEVSLFETENVGLGFLAESMMEDGIDSSQRYVVLVRNRCDDGFMLLRVKLLNITPIFHASGVKTISDKSRC